MICVNKYWIKHNSLFFVFCCCHCFLTSSKGTNANWAQFFTVERHTFFFLVEKISRISTWWRKKIPPKMAWASKKTVWKSYIGTRWTMGKMSKDKNLYITFIQIKGTNKEELGSDQKKSKQPLFFLFWNCHLCNGKRFTN